MTADNLWNNPGAIAATLAASAFATLIWWQRSSSRRKFKKQKQRWSITSTVMGVGAFPPAINVPEPVINACILFQDCPSVQDIVQQVVPKMLEYKRMATIPMPHTSSDRSCVGLNPSDLVRRVEIDGDDDTMYETVTEYLHEPLSSGRGHLPWWEILIIDNKGSGKSCALWRVHHCLADGLSMVALTEQIIRYADGSPMEPLIPEGMRKKFKIKKSWYQLFFEVLVSAIKILTMPASNYDHPTVFSKCMNKDLIHNRNRELVRFVDTPLDFVKEIKNAANVTINDVLYTCLSQAIHMYLVREECPILAEQGSKLLCRSLMPVGFPRNKEAVLDKEQALGNKWCFIETDFFVGQTDIMERLKLVHQQMTALKTSPTAVVQLNLQNMLPTVLPRSFTQQATFDIFSRRSVIFSNVPGPTKPCLFASKEVIGVQMFFSNLIPQTGFISYRGQIFGNICLDPEGIRNCKSISILYSQALVLMAERVNVAIPNIVAQHAKQPML